MFYSSFFLSLPLPLHFFLFIYPNIFRVNEFYGKESEHIQLLMMIIVRIISIFDFSWWNYSLSFCLYKVHVWALLCCIDWIISMLCSVCYFLKSISLLMLFIILTWLPIHLFMFSIILNLNHNHNHNSTATYSPVPLYFNSN